jgi:hypothetical protein
MLIFNSVMFKSSANVEYCEMRINITKQSHQSLKTMPLLLRLRFSQLVVIDISSYSAMLELSAA